MTAPHLMAFALLAVLVIAVPGPSILFMVSRALTMGRQPALLTVLSNTGGQFLQVSAVALGVGELVQRSLPAFLVIKLAGAAYLVWIGVRTFRGRRALVGKLEGGPPELRPARIIWEGALVGATNPKTAVFFTAVLPQFVIRSEGQVPLQLLGFGLVWVALVLVGDSCWALAASRAGSWLRRSPRQAATVGAVSGVVTVGLGVGLALTGNRRP